MPIDPSILQGIRPPAPGPSILDTYAQITQLQALKTAGEERRAAAQEKQAIAARKAQIEQTLKDAVTFDPVSGEPKVDYGKLTAHLDPSLVFEVRQQLSEDADRITKARTSGTDLLKKQKDLLASAGRSVRAAKYDPTLFHTEAVALGNVGALTAAEVEAALAMTDPAEIQRVADAAIAAVADADPQALQRIEVPDPNDPTKSVYQFVRPTEGATYPTVPASAKVGTPPNVGSFEDYVIRRFGPAPTAEQITQARKDYQQADDRPITIHTGQRPITQTAEAGLISRLNGQWTTATKGPRELAQQLTTMRLGLQAAERGDMAQGTEAVLQPFLKILDPNSVVREGEFFRLREGQSYIARARGIMQRLTQGGFVPLSELKKYAALAEEIAKRQDSYVAGVRGRIGKVAERYSIPEELVFETTAPILDTSTTPAGGGGGAAGLTYQDYQRAKGK